MNPFMSILPKDLENWTITSVFELLHLESQMAYSRKQKKAGVLMKTILFNFFCLALIRG